MKIIERFRDAIAERAAEAVAASLTVLLVWVAYQVVPAILPAIEAAISKRVLLAILVSSAVLNTVFLLVIWLISKGDKLRIKYGVYWDRQKNPHCPSCKKPISAYADYAYSGRGYYCKPCNKVFPLTDALGNKIEPAQALNEL